MSTLNLNNPLVQSYVAHSAILGLKLLAVTLITIKTRLTQKVSANPEDAAYVNGKVKYDDPKVERVRRAHLNDLENIPAFWILGALYLTTRPEIWAITLFRLFTGFRIIHTISYLTSMPQPTRGIAFVVPYIVLVYMGLKVVTHYSMAI